MTKQKDNKPVNTLFELGLEEVPARFMDAMLANLKEKAEKELQSARLSYKSLNTYGTPRRLVLYVEGLPSRQEDLSKEVKGPPKEHAFNGNGAPTKAGEGFAASQGIKVSDLKIKKVGEREFVCASVIEKGIETNKLLEKLLPQIINSLYLPISMRWADVDCKFVRPIHWIFAVCGNKLLNVEIAGIRSSNKTYGHRFFSSKPIMINITKGADLNTFKKELYKGMVMVDQDERREKIRELVKAAAKRADGIPTIDKDLLNEVTFLVEWPVPVSGSFKKEYLKLPKDVLVTSMKKNQKYFSVTDMNGNLLPLFINIVDGTKQANLKGVQEGNEKVLSARLSDAKFFFEEDRKKPLEEIVPNLMKVAFYEKLGTVYQKVERITVLSEWIAKELKLADSKKDDIREIARLCKADLLTQMVYEFPVLQGVMGREYSLLEGKSKEVANGIYEHYLPRFADDELPVSIEGAVVGLADKIDSIVGCFSINLIPTGSEDPFGLRRQAQGIVNILLGKKVNLELDNLIEKAYKLYEPLFLSEAITSAKIAPNSLQKVISDVLSFIAARLKGSMLESQIRYDVADAVLFVFRDVLESCEKAKAITKCLKENWFTGIIQSADRVKRLAVNATRGNVIESDFVQDDEKKLYGTFLDVNTAVGELLNKGDHEAAIREISKMTHPVDNFFVKVMVMDKDEKLRANRLALLKTLERMYLEIADFSKVVI